MNIIARKDAIRQGLKYYYSGKPCKNGHICERIISGECVICTKEYFKHYRKQYYVNHKEYINQYSKQWHKNNPHKIVVYKEHRDTYLKGSIPSWYEVELIKQFYQKRNELNEKWDLQGNNKLEVDHIIPIISKSVCGLHCWANLQLLDKTLNGSKHNNYEQDW